MHIDCANRTGRISGFGSGRKSNDGLILTLMVSLSLTAPSLADDETDGAVTALETLIVTDAGDEESYKSDRSTATSRMAVPVKEIPLSLSTVTRQRMDDELIWDDIEAIDRSTGMNAAGSPYPSEISSRGFSTLSNVNGLRMQSEDSNFTPVLDSFLLGGIEIMRGPAGLLEGAGEPGGVVNRVLKRPTDHFTMGGSVTFGGNGLKRTEFETGGSLVEDNSLRARIAATTTDSDYFYDVADHQRFAVLGALEADLTDRTTVRLSAVHQKDDRTPFWGLPSHEDGYLLDVDRSTFLGSSFGRFNTDYTLVATELSHEFENGWTAKVMGNYFSQKIDEFDLMAIGPAYDVGDETFVDLGLNVNQDQETGYNLDASLSGTVELLGREHEVVFGASHIRSNLKVDERWGYDGFPVNVNDPEVNLPVPAEADGGIQQDRDYTQYGVYGQVNYKLTDRLTTLFGGRLNWAKMDSDITGIVIQDYQENAFFTPLLGLVYDLTPSTSIYVSYADIYEPQFQRDADRNALPPLTGTQYEAGVKTEFLEGRLLATAAIFDITRKNQAHIVGPWMQQIYEADGTTNSRGFELEISGEINEAWKVFAGYAYTHSKVTESQDPDRLGKWASNTPKHKFNLWVTHQFQQEYLEGLQLGAGLTAASSILDYDNALEAQGHVTVDAAASYKINQNLDFSVKVSNLFDDKYYERLGTSGMYHYYGAPRTAAFQLKGRF